MADELSRTARIVWKKVLEPEELPEGRVKPVSCGGLGIRVIADDGLDDALARALGHNAFSLVEIVTDPLLV